MSTKKRTISPRQPKPSKEQARAWLSTVLTPMSSALQAATDFMEGGSWSFRAGPQELEYIWSTEKMLAPIYKPNREQLFRFHRELRGAAEKYDVAREQLRQKCREAFDRLMAAPGFQERAAGLEPRQWRYCAEYVVNGLRDLPDTYSLREFWTAQGREFLELKKLPGLTEAFQQLQDAGEEFKKRLGNLQEVVNRVQQELADRFGLPVVEPMGEAMA